MDLQKQFTIAASDAGTVVVQSESLDDAATYISRNITGELILPEGRSLKHSGFSSILKDYKIKLISENFRSRGPAAEGGVTGASFAIAETGTIVLESTDESIRLASTLPEKHFVLLDRSKIIKSHMDAVPILRRFNDEIPRNYLAYITGPSRTADIERVLTIGVHGPKELHVIMLSGFSSDMRDN